MYLEVETVPVTTEWTNLPPTALIPPSILEKNRARLLPLSSLPHYDVGNGFSRHSIIVIYVRNIYLRHSSVDPWNRFVSLCFALLGSCSRLSKTVGDSLSDNKMKIPIAERASNFTSTTTLPPVSLYRYSFQKRLNSKIIKQLMWLQLLFVTSCRIHRYNSFASTTSTQSACFLFLSPASCCSSAYGFVLLIWACLCLPTVKLRLYLE